jgi:hypothetical protein
LVSFFIGVIVSKFRVKELVLDTFPPSSTFRLTLVEISRGAGGGVGVVDGGLQQISLISFLRDLIIS